MSDTAAMITVWGICIKQMPQARFALKLRNTPSPMATFPSFKLAWDNALHMFQDANATICGCHYTPPIGCEPAQAEFMVAIAGKIEEYLIHQEA